MAKREFDYDRITYFTMVGDVMDDGKRDGIENGATLVCVPIKVGDLICGDVVVVKSSGKGIVGVVDNVGKRFVTLSRNNPECGKVNIPTRLSKFYLVIETRHKKAGAYDGVTIGFRGLA